VDLIVESELRIFFSETTLICIYDEGN